MNKRIMSVVFFVGIMTVLYAEAPELKNVMPNSWRKVTRLSAEEQEAFMRENSAVLESMSDYELGFYSGSLGFGDLGWGDGSEFDCYLVYKQQTGNDIFYRIICTDTDNPDFFSPAVRFIQILVYKNAVVVAAPYRKITEIPTQFEIFDIVEYYSVDIIEGGDGAKGVLKTKLYVTRVDKEDDYRIESSVYRKGQARGYTGSHYFLMSEVNKKIRGEQCIIIEIDASHCLVDPKIPLRYSLQSAFDNDPATSYVENTDNDLMNIHVYVSWHIIQRFAVINGYAQNRMLYKKNNRVKAVGSAEPALLSDNKLDYQIFDWPHQAFSVVEIYKGDKYNDTCLAELNIYTTTHGWLFEDLDE